MADIGQLTRQKRVEVIIDMGEGDSVTIGFDRNRVTPAWVAGAEERDKNNDTQSLPKALAEVILDWDVTHEGSPYAPTADNLSVLSYPAQAEILEQILQAAVPSRAEGNDLSKSRSGQPAVSTAPEKSPNGPATEPSLTSSASPSPT